MVFLFRKCCFQRSKELKIQIFCPVRLPHGDCHYIIFFGFKKFFSHMPVFTYSVVLYSRRTGNLYEGVLLLPHDSLPRHYQASEDNYRSCRFILRACIWLKKTFFSLNIRDGECHVHPICAFTVFNGNDFGNLDTL